MIRRPPTWAERVLLEHGDQVHAMNEHFTARAQVGRSRLWWAVRRWEEQMAELMRWYQTTEPGTPPPEPREIAWWRRP